MVETWDGEPKQPRCPECGRPVVMVVQEHRFVRTPADPLKDGEPGFTIPGPLRADPCGDVVTLEQARLLGWNHP